MISNANLLVKQGLLKRPLDFGFVMGALSLARTLHPAPSLSWALTLALTT